MLMDATWDILKLLYEYNLTQKNVYMGNPIGCHMGNRVKDTDTKYSDIKQCKRTKYSMGNRVKAPSTIWVTG